MNSNNYWTSDIHTLFDGLQTAKAETDDESAIIELSRLYYAWLKAGMFDCKNSGFGTDPYDGFTDVNGESPCTDPKGSFKCRLTLRWRSMYNNFANNQLTFT